MLAGGDKDAQAAALKSANAGWERPPTPPSGGSSNGFNSTAAPSAFASTGNFGSPSTFAAPAATGFGAPTSGFAPTSEVTTGFGGKPAPVQPPHPEI
jgi:hypothetical protein